MTGPLTYAATFMEQDIHATGAFNAKEKTKKSHTFSKSHLKFDSRFRQKKLDEISLYFFILLVERIHRNIELRLPQLTEVVYKWKGQRIGF